MFANTQMMGVDIGFPDVCLTPPVAAPIPYPNIGLGPVTVPFVPNIFMACAPSHNLMDPPLVTLGDQPGVMLGVASGMVMGPSRHIIGSFTTLVGGAPLTRMTTFNLQNNTNCPGVRLVPSQPKVLCFKP